MKVKVRSIIIMLLIIICQAVWAQGVSNNATTYNRANLLGKKWSMMKNIQGKNISYSFVFDNDSITNVVIINNDTTVLRYAYYLSENFQDSFDSSFVGNTSSGKWLNICRYYTQGGLTKSDRANMMIFSLTNNELSYGKSPEFPMVLTAMPLE